MSEHDDRYASNDLPRTTGEFRAAPDISASTAEFKAFAKAYDSQPAQPWADESWPDQPRAGAPGQRYARRSTTTIVIIAVAVVALVVAIAVIGLGG